MRLAVSLYLERASADDVDAGLGGDLGVSFDLQPAAIVARAIALAGVDLDAVEIAASHRWRLRASPADRPGRDSRSPAGARREQDRPRSLRPCTPMRISGGSTFLALRPSESLEFDWMKQSGAVTRARPSSSSARLAVPLRLRTQSRAVPRTLASAATTIGFCPQTSAGRNVLVSMAISTRLVAFSLSSVISTVCGRSARPTSPRSASARSIPDCFSGPRSSRKRFISLPTASAVAVCDRLHSALLVVDGGAVYAEAGDADQNRQA